MMEKLFHSTSQFMPSWLKRSIRWVARSPYLNPYWYRFVVGGKWEEIGQLQFDFLIGQGLEPHHFLLDVGCGSLRGGIHFIRYLDPAHYYGVDKDAALLEAGRRELMRRKLDARKPQLFQLENFAFSTLGQKFDFALAQSVFTHLPLNHVQMCIWQIEKVLEDRGKFFATFWENLFERERVEPIAQGDRIATHFDHDPFHYHFSTFEETCRGTRLKIDYIGSWGHPRNQKMLMFTRVKG